MFRAKRITPRCGCARNSARSSGVRAGPEIPRRAGFKTMPPCRPHAALGRRRKKPPPAGETAEPPAPPPPHGPAAHHGLNDVRIPMAQKVRHFLLQYVPNLL